MNILFVTSESVPFAKTGGLADVSGALPQTLAKMGHCVSVVMPAYRQIFDSGAKFEKKNVSVSVPLDPDKKPYQGAVLYTRLNNSNVDYYFIEHDAFFRRDGLYNYRTSSGELVDYGDNCERFAFFSRAALELIRIFDLKIDVIHANDWQCGLVPAYLETLYRTQSPKRIPMLPPSGYENEMYDRIVSVFTIHNMAYQGVFRNHEMPSTGLDWGYFTYDKMEFYGKLNFLKTGILFSDKITTVSPTYAQEIQTDSFGFGLEGVLKFRQNDLHGILNGVDVEVWNPTSDLFLVERYSVQNVHEIKPKCKAALQKKFNLPVKKEVPLFAIVSRLAYQKGLDLVADKVSDWIERYGIQFVLLGTGDPLLEKRFSDLAVRYPQNAAVKLGYSEELSHQIEAGSDLFLMPSRYEPCGLNQMYSQIYGTLPLVRKTGGLADTVVNANNETLQDGTADGFNFYWGTSDDLDKAVNWAVHCFYERPDAWKRMVETAMKQDWSWEKSAKNYLELYQNARKSDF